MNARLLTASLLLTACSLSMAANHADHSGHDMSNMAPMGKGIGEATGVIRSVGGNGDFLNIKHGPFTGIDMGSMTMGFSTMGGLDLSGYKEGDNVAFRVKQGRDGSLRIMAICNTDTQGADCLTKRGMH